MPDPPRPATARVCLGLGANLGDPPATIQKALELIETRKLGRVVARSSLYRSEPVGFADQPWFMNAAALVDTTLDPADFHAGLKAIERELGRPDPRVKDGPRVIDLDLLLWQDRVLQTPDLTVPHPRMSARRFVLAPLAEIAPHALHPSSNRTVAQLLLELDDPAAVIKAGPRE